MDEQKRDIVAAQVRVWGADAVQLCAACDREAKLHSCYCEECEREIDS